MHIELVLLELDVQLAECEGQAAIAPQSKPAWFLQEALSQAREFLPATSGRLGVQIDAASVGSLADRIGKGKGNVAGGMMKASLDIRLQVESLK